MSTESKALATREDMDMTPPESAVHVTSVYMGDAFEEAQRRAKALAASSLVPSDYRGQTGVANCMVAMELANRLGTSPLMVMQNLYPDVAGKGPAWKSSFVIALLRASERFAGLDYRMTGEPGTDARTCQLVGVSRETGQEVEGPPVSLAMAKAEGWTSKKGSKWRTMPELMIRYRAATFFARVHTPDLLVGLHSQGEVADMRVDPAPTRLEQKLQALESGEPIEGEVETPSLDDRLEAVVQEARALDLMTSAREGDVQRARLAGDEERMEEWVEVLTREITDAQGGA